MARSRSATSRRLSVISWQPILRSGRSSSKRAAPNSTEKGETMKTSLALLAVVFAAPVAAQNTVNEATVSTDAAIQVATAALAACRADGQKVTVTVVDHAGREKLRVRDDGAAPHTEGHSFRKAYTAASY